MKWCHRCNGANNGARVTTSEASSEDQAGAASAPDLAVPAKDEAVPGLEAAAVHGAAEQGRPGSVLLPLVLPLRGSGGEN